MGGVGSSRGASNDLTFIILEEVYTDDTTILERGALHRRNATDALPMGQRLTKPVTSRLSTVARVAVFILIAVD
jgi:hypothetical protein